MGYAGKLSIAIALLRKESSNANAIDLLRHAGKVAERNDFTHSFLTHADDKGTIRLVRRTLRDGNYKMEPREVDKDSMRMRN